MMDDKMHAPQIRFSGFSDDWEQRKLGEVSNHRGGTAIEKYFDDNGKYKVISIGSYGLDSRYVDQGIRAHSNEITDKRIVYAGELTMILNDKTANGTIIGRTLLIENDNEYVVNQRTEIISPKEGFNSRFAYTLLNGPFRHKIKQVVQGGTQIYVNYSSVEKLTLYLPIIEEQKKVGVFFEKLDKLITLHQCKLDKLINIKKSMLEKMFVEKNTDVPEIRFKGFTDTWEQRKLGDISEIITGGTPKTTEEKYWNPKEIPWMSSGEINNMRIVKTEDSISKNGFDNSSAKWVNKNSVLIALAGQGKTRGMVAVNEIKLTTNQSIAAIQPNCSLYYEFLFHNLGKRYEELRLISSGDGTRGGLNKKIISELNIFAPSYTEQKNIGILFKQIDLLITLHQRKLEKLKNIKTSCLEKMFV